MSSEELAEAARLYDEKRFEDALSHYILLAEQGDELAARWAGWIINEGLCTWNDPREAIRYYLLAAESGSKAAMFDLASMYGYVREYQKAIEWYERSAAEGSIPALYRLGRYHQSGKGVTKNEEKAFTYFEDAASHGHIFAKGQLMRRRLLHDHGRVVGSLLYKFWCFKQSVEIGRIVLREEESQTDERLIE